MRDRAWKVTVEMAGAHLGGMSLREVLVGQMPLAEMADGIRRGTRSEQPVQGDLPVRQGRFGLRQGIDHPALVWKL